MDFFPTGFVPDRQQTNDSAPDATNTESAKDSPRLKSAPSSDYNKSLFQSQRYLKALGWTGKVRFQLIPERPNDERKPYSLEEKLADALPELKRKNAEGYGVFVVVNDGGTKDTEISQVNAVFTDYDSKAGTPTPTYALAPSFTVQTSEGNHHAYWLTNDVSTSEFKQLQQALASKYGTDPQVCNLARVMRLPGFKHVKGKPRMVTMSEVVGGVYDRKALEQLSASSVPDTLPTEFVIPSSLRSLYQDVKALEDGNVNNGLYGIAKDMGKTGESYDVCEFAAKTALAERGTEWDERTRDTFQRAYSLGSMEPAKKRGNQIKVQREILRRYYGGRLRTNELDGKRELDRKPIADFSLLYLDACTALDMNFAKQTVDDVLSELATEQTYHPVREQILAWVAEHGASGRELLNTLATDHMGCDEEVENLYVRKVLLSYMARLFNPGCKVDTCLVFAGAQGKGKTEFIRLLSFGRCDKYSPSATDKDAFMKAHRSTIVELDEIDSTFDRKGQEAIKELLSGRKDSFRPPYGRADDTRDYLRGFIFVASTNNMELLRDDTGSRRFLPLRVKRDIDVDWFRLNLPRLMAATYVALHELLGDKDPQELSKQDAIWWMSAAEEAEQAERNKQFESVDPMLDIVLDSAMSLGETFTTLELFDKLRTSNDQFQQLSVKNGKDTGRFKRLLTSNGYEFKGSVRHAGKVQSCYVKAETTEEPTTTDVEPVTPRKYQRGDTVYYRTIQGTFNDYTTIYHPNGTDEEVCNVKLITGAAETCKEYELAFDLIGNVI